MSKRVVIVGGVAGGMSCAARLKRLDDQLEVTVYEKGGDVSFANCGMPYYVGGIIQDRGMMLVQGLASLQGRYGLDIRVRHEVVRIDRNSKHVEVKDLDSGAVLSTPYDVLVLSPGAAPIRPPIPGANGPKVFVLNDLADMDAIAAATADARHACVVGAGFIGLELVENFRHRGLDVSLVEMLDHVMPRMDREMTQPLLQELLLHGVKVYLDETAQAIEGSEVLLKSGKRIDSDFVCLCVGVRPTSTLAKNAGLTLNERGFIRVDEHLRTSDPDIYAVGDAVEVTDFVTGQPTAVALAGPANRQGRIAADNICGRDSAYRGSQGTGIVKVFNLAAAQTGLTEHQVKAAGIPYHRVYVHPMQHPKYYPGAQPVSVKLVFRPDGGILGAQVIGAEGVDVMINALALAQRTGQTVEDLEHADLAYSPQWGGAKHGVNMVGFAASNMLRGDLENVEPESAPADIFWLDVREAAEAETGTIPGATLISVDKLRSTFHELPRDREIGVYCAVGLRGYIAYRFLKQQGFRVRNLNGGFRSWTWFHRTPAAPLPLAEVRKAAAPKVPTPDTVRSGRLVPLDVSGMQCPGPIVKVKQTMEEMAPGDVLEVLATDAGFACDVPAWCKSTGHTLLDVRPEGPRYVVQILKNDTAIPCEAVCAVPERPTAKAKTIVCFSNDLDRVMAAFVIANGAAAMGNEVTIFFTFWGLNVLRRPSGPPVSKGLLDRMFGAMMPRGPERLTLSRMHMGGMGTRMMKYVMKQKNVMSLPELIAAAKVAGVRLVACSMSMDVMGIKAEELVEGVEIGGVGYYLGKADEANVNLFI
jgi:NADPH-dependent 2,4-dienoyl-CoA reductase/sulfur reductase-like enzyme/peroxiredoxin family protein/TusA-related sulfurtransferase/rhodanese-related sulfurtransferase